MNRLQTIDADTLQSTAYEPASFVVDDLLPQGLHLLAGAPKIGKSWLALWLCLCAAQGKPLWTFATRPCQVLYLCLEDSFQRSQRYSSMTKEEQSYSEKEHHTETVTADTEKSDLSVVLKALSPSIEYDDGEFRGTLYLDHSTISTVASGYTTKSYTVSATKEIDNLDTNDMAYVPDTTTKNGVTVQLQSVDWQVQGTSLVDDILVPAQYKAVATYAGRASYRAATGYVTTAKYIGDILRSRRCVKGGSFRPMKRRQSLLPRPRENWITYFPNWAENLALCRRWKSWSRQRKPQRTSSRHCWSSFVGLRRTIRL